MNTNTPDTIPTIRQFRAMERAFHNASDRLEAIGARGWSGVDLEAHGNMYVTCRDDFMQTPAPDLAGLRAKLKTVFEADDNGFIVEWSHAYLAQTIADIERLLCPTATTQPQTVSQEVGRLARRLEDSLEAIHEAARDGDCMAVATLAGDGLISAALIGDLVAPAK